ncbi:MAG: glycosyltransferase [bacterium]|nr:MAG: glycosyltransferase [bacterium]
MTEENGKHALRICLVGPAYPYRGGISHYNTSLARELTRRHDVHIVNYSRLYPAFLFPGKTQYDDSDSAMRIESARLIDSMNPFTWVRAGFHIVGFHPDAVIMQWWHPYFAPALFKVGQILRMMRRGKVIFVCHNVVPHERSVLDRILSRLAFSVAHGFLVQSEEDRDNLLRLRRGAQVVVHPLPLFDFFKRGELTRQQARERFGGDSNPIILFFGYIRPYKGLRYLLEAMPRIHERTGARLMVVGEFYEDDTPYRELVEESGLQDTVTFVDRYVGNEEVESYFMACDLVVLPYVSATQSGIVQISLSFDRPVVVTRVGGLPEVVVEGKTGFIVPPEDSRSLAGAVIRFFEEGWGEKMAPFFAEEKRRFSWSEVAASLMRLLEATGRKETRRIE